ncbi:hypothetical protein BDN71DRAFT_1499817 [Pleurotus eryngii]|uniref:Uncharacterized protein n=1 Tax=Pleurotus eryngii TaxID=5323 RepID=A0A9P5ZIH6_PLEER|nr:hypothetical protein BDN71DRAFT_1499817 [Pleurotus eryngii]
MFGLINFGFSEVYGLSSSKVFLRRRVLTSVVASSEVNVWGLEECPHTDLQRHVAMLDSYWSQPCESTSIVGII